MVLETIAFALIGVAVGFGALALLPGWFPTARALTVSTAVVAALLSGVIARYTLADRFPGLALAISAIGSALLVSVLARPEAGDRAGRHRGAHRRHRSA